MLPLSYILEIKDFFGMYFFSFLSIIGWVSFFYFWRKKYTAFYPLLVTTGLISTLYIFAYLKILNFGSIVIFILGLFFLLKTIFQNRKTIFSPYGVTRLFKTLPVSVIFFILAGIAWYVFTLKASIFGWDEFFWGQFSKAILNSNNFYNLSSAIFTPKANYPPGIALLHYFFEHFGRYSESGFYFAQGIIILSALALVFDLVKKNIGQLLVFGLAIFSVTVYFGPGLLSMMNDHVAGVIFGAAFLASIFILRSSKSKLLLIPVIFALPLIKSTSLILSLTLVLVSGLDLFIFNTGLLIKEKRKPKLDKLAIILVIILALVAFLPMESWGFYLKNQGIQASPGIPALAKIKNAFSQNASPREKLTVENFKKALATLAINQQEGTFGANQPIAKSYFKVIKKINRPGLAIPLWLAIFTILLGIIFYFQKPKERVQSLILYFSLLLGLAMFLFLHLLVFTFYFSDYEGPRLASMERYIGAYFIGLALVTIGSVAFFIKENPKKSKLLKVVSLIIFIYLLIFHTPPLTKLVVPPSMMASSTNSTREKTRVFSSYINENTAPTNKVWFIYQNTNGWECMMVRYDIAPRIMNTRDWSLGEKYGPDDHWTNGMSKESWAKQLSDDNYNYVFLASVDDNFWSHYEGLFDNPVEAKLHKLFKITRENGTIRLALP